MTLTLILINPFTCWQKMLESLLIFTEQFNTKLPTDELKCVLKLVFSMSYKVDGAEAAMADLSEVGEELLWVFLEEKLGHLRILQAPRPHRRWHLGFRSPGSHPRRGDGTIWALSYTEAAVDSFAATDEPEEPLTSAPGTDRRRGERDRGVRKKGEQKHTPAYREGDETQRDESVRQILNRQK